MLLSHPFHLELFLGGNGRESRVVLVSSQKFPQGISSHTDRTTHVHISRSLSCTLHVLRNVLQGPTVIISNKDS